MTAPIEVRRRPLFVLLQNRVLLCDISNALDQLWTAFEEVARSNEAFYSGPYSSKKGAWLEQKAAEFMGRLWVRSQSLLVRTLGQRIIRQAIDGLRQD